MPSFGSPASSAPAHGRHSSTPRTRPLLEAAVQVTMVVQVLILVASAGGLTVAGLYRDPVAVSSILQGYDLVTLSLVFPGLAVALPGVRRGSVLARLVWIGLLAACVRTYAGYVFAAALTAFFLVHVSVLTAATIALLLALASFDVSALATGLGRWTLARPFAVWLVLLGVGLAAVSIYGTVWFVVTGGIPPGTALVETDELVQVGAALDLWLLVPAYLTGGLLLWRRAAWGYVAAVAVLVSGVVQQLGRLVAMPFQVRAGVAGAVAGDPVEQVAAAVLVVTTAALLGPLVVRAFRSRRR